MESLLHSLIYCQRVYGTRRGKRAKELLCVKSPNVCLHASDRRPASFMNYYYNVIELIDVW
jgi:hypothetical protein